MKKIKVNKSICIGCGSCVGIAENNFDFEEQEETGKTTAVVTNENPTKEAEEAAECCPVGAITIEEEN